MQTQSTNKIEDFLTAVAAQRAAMAHMGELKARTCDLMNRWHEIGASERLELLNNLQKTTEIFDEVTRIMAPFTDTPKIAGELVEFWRARGTAHVMLSKLLGCAPPPEAERDVAAPAYRESVGAAITPTAYFNDETVCAWVRGILLAS